MRVETPTRDGIILREESLTDLPSGTGTRVPVRETVVSRVRVRASYVWAYTMKGLKNPAREMMPQGNGTFLSWRIDCR